MHTVRYLSLLVAAGALLTLVGCDRAYREATTKLTPGQSTGYDVRDVYGPPEIEYKEADGSLVWEFPKGPAGLETYMIRIGPDNKLVSRDQVLSEPYFAKIQKGQTRAEVRRILGKPASNVTFDLKKEEVWMWRYQESGATMNFHVHFDLNGSVLYSSKLMEQTGR